MDLDRWQRIETLYHAALARPASERADWLAQACAADGALRDEVEKLLAMNDAAGSFLAAPALDFAAGKFAIEGTALPMETQIGNYQILGPLGAGGMGVVYRARDTRLNRDVAIKVLPADFAQDADRLRRFELEAKATGSLNHPNILTIYDIGTTSPENGGTSYLVAELLEGEELRDQLNNGALPMKRAIDYAQQIAAGLTAAHAKGIVHRDLKPENLFITKDSRVKILDFGLAKMEPPQNVSAGSDVATLKQLTTPGTVMGTVAYMSPEQVRGEVVDARSDLFSFGLILYEMLTGKRAFEGATMADLMSAILREEPPELCATNPQIHPQLEKIVQRCLQKKAEARFQTASDLGFALSTLTTASSSGANRTQAVQALEAAATTKRSGWRERGWMIAAGVLGVIALALGVAYVRRPVLEAEPMRLYMTPPERAKLFDWPTISPDGRTLAFVAEVDGKRQLWVRPLNATTAGPLVELRDDRPLPFWSPDNKFIAYFESGKLKKIALAGGTPETLCEVSIRGNATWNREEVILFGAAAAGIQRVSAHGGAVSNATTVDTANGESAHYSPVFLPDGRHFLYLNNHADPAKNGIYLTSVEGAASKQLLLVNASPVGVLQHPADQSKGYLAFVRRGELMAQPFDLSRNQLTGNPVRIADGSVARYSLSSNGVLILQAESEADEQLTWFDRMGNKTGTVGLAGKYYKPRLSPDGQSLTASRPKPGAGADIHLLDLANGASTPFTFDPSQDEFPIWSPDGSRIVWVSWREGTANLFQKAASGAGQEEVLLRSAHRKRVFDWSADGRFILYHELNAQTSFDLWVLPMEGERKPWVWLNTPAVEGTATFSPDGKWIAYQSDESGHFEIYLQAFVPGALASGSKRQLSTSGGTSPYWRRDGRELYYLTIDGKLMAVDITPGAELKATAPKELFAPTGYRAKADRGYTVTGDGQRFLFVTSVEDASLSPFTVVLNWMTEIKK